MRSSQNYLRFSSVFIVFSFLCPLGFSEPFTAQVFEPNSERKNLLFNLKRDELSRAQGEKFITGIFTAPDGTVAINEEVIMRQGKILSYKLQQKQLSEVGLLQVSDSSLTFSYTRNQNTETRSEKAPENLIIGPTTIEFVKSHFDQIMKDEVKVRYAVLDRCETVGFKLFKHKDTKVNGMDAVIIKMKPSSFVIAALVKPIYLTFDRQGTRLLEMHGRTLPKVWAHGRWKDLDGDIVYHYKAPI